MPKSDELYWSADGFMLLFCFEVGKAGVRLILEIGPGDRDIAQALLSAANDPQSKTVGAKYNRIYRKRMVSGKAVQDRDLARCFEELDHAWAEFTADLPALGASLAACLHASRDDH